MKKILIVDDDALLCETLTLLFMNLGADEVNSAKSLKGVQEFAMTVNQYDLAIIDIHLGSNQPSGIDVYQWLNTHHFHGKAVFFTGHGNLHPLVVKASLVADAELIQKPNGVQRLIEVVAESA